MRDEYTMGQAAAVLGITYKTLTKWCRKTNPPIEPAEIPEEDGRLRILSGAQIDRLAKLHHRMIDDTALDRAENWYLLNSRSQSVRSVGKNIEMMLAEIARLRLQLQQKEQAPVNQQKNIPKDIPERQLFLSTDGVPWLPEGWVTLRSMIDEHHLPRRTVDRHFQKHLFSYHQGKWRTSNNIIDYALDPAEQQGFYIYWQQHDRFIRCGSCPHALEPAESVVPE